MFQPPLPAQLKLFGRCAIIRRESSRMKKLYLSEELVIRQHKRSEPTRVAEQYDIGMEVDKAGMNTTRSWKFWKRESFSASNTRTLKMLRRSTCSRGYMVLVSTIFRNHLFLDVVCLSRRGVVQLICRPSHGIQVVHKGLSIARRPRCWRLRSELE